MNNTDKWDKKYNSSGSLFGIKPNEFMIRQLGLIDQNKQSGNLDAGMTALSIADGEAYNSLWLAQQGLAVTSIDISKAAQDKARNNPVFSSENIHFICGDILDFNADDSSFDLITVFFLHLPSKQRQLLNKKINTLLKPNGILLYECFHKNQTLENWGPSDKDLLIDEEDMRISFCDLTTLSLNQISTTSYEETHGEKQVITLQFAGLKKNSF